MSYLRELLKSKKPELYSALENAWTIANKEVFPVMSSNDESVNSFPHSKNLETYLNNILEPCDDLFSENSEVYLSPYELYCILMAILFHDFGRIKFEEGHGSFSKKFILNNYEKYYIPSEELADAISEICEIHKPLEEDVLKPATILLDSGMGKVRVRELAGLLVLVDEMDTSYKRLKELYVLDQPKYFSGKGLFRNYIRGITYDFLTKTVYVSVDNKILENAEKNNNLNTIRIKKDKKNYKLKDSPDKQNDFFDFITKGLNFAKKELAAFEDIRDNEIIIEQNISKDKILKFQNAIETKLNQLLKSGSDSKKLLKKLVELKNPPLKTDEIFRKLYSYYEYYKEKFDDPFITKDIEDTAYQKWPLIVVLPIIIRAIKKSESCTGKSIYLSRLGIHVKKWLITYKEHLYDTNGNETVEPVLEIDFLIKVAEGMWELNKGMPEDDWSSYIDLLNEVVFSGDIMLIRLAVQRIEIISREIAEKYKFPSCINYDNRRWCLLRINGKFIALDEIIPLINKLKK